MSFTVINVEQGSPEWFTARAGRLTGSRAAAMLSTPKSGGEAAGRRNLRTQLVLERVTGKPQGSTFESSAMADGKRREPDAFAYYEAISGHVVNRTGFLAHDSIGAGCSLDGHVGDFAGIVEIKCPIPATHLDYLKTGKIPGDYMKQIVHGLWVSGAQWCDWLSYHPDFPDALRAKLVRVERDEAAIAEYERAALKFLAEVATEVEALKTMMDFRGQLSAAQGVA